MDQLHGFDDKAVKEFPVECPKCHEVVNVMIGETECPHCHNIILLEINR